MGQSNGRNGNGNGNGSNGKQHYERPLTSQPFKKDLKEFKPWGPACLRCGENIDTRVGASVSNSMRGARRSQRQGYVHDRCFEVAPGTNPVVHSQLLSSINEGSVEIERGKFMDMVTGRGVVMEFPVYTENEMHAAIEAGQALPA